MTAIMIINLKTSYMVLFSNWCLSNKLKVASSMVL